MCSNHSWCSNKNPELSARVLCYYDIVMDNRYYFFPVGTTLLRGTKLLR